MYLKALELVNCDVLPCDAMQVLDRHIRVQLRKARNCGVCAGLAHVFLAKEELREVEALTTRCKRDSPGS